MSLIGSMIADRAKEMQEAKVEEEPAQREYVFSRNLPLAVQRRSTSWTSCGYYVLRVRSLTQLKGELASAATRLDWMLCAFAQHGDVCTVHASFFFGLWPLGPCFWPLCQTQAQGSGVDGRSCTPRCQATSSI